MTNTARELDILRQNLLDLTLKNKLLNYRPSKRRTVEVIDESPREIYDILVLQEKSMRFSPARVIEDARETLDGAYERPSTIWKEPDDSSEFPEHFFDINLNTPYVYENLMDRLFYAFNQSRSVFEEQGYSVLYIALGFLAWKEPRDPKRIIKAPLILIPVELTRVGKKRAFSLAWTGEDITTSLTLQAKLGEMGIELPEFEMPEEKAGIDDYFAAVKLAVADQKDWNLLTETVLDFFNFRKFVMYKDLDPATWPDDQPPADHLLVKAIFEPQPSDPDDPVISEDEVDTKVDIENSFIVLDADSSQIAAIECVKAGKNLVVQGPPGTGKSQTIANVIAELLAMGRSILFVSEKMAALDVVKSRLDAVGLGTFCIELHSHKAKKKEVLNELQRTICSPVPRSIDLAHEIRELEALKDQLNEYVTVLHTPFGERNQTPFQLFSLKAKADQYFQQHGRKMEIVPFPDAEWCSTDQWSEALSTLEKIQEILPLLSTVKGNPWNGCSPGRILPPDREVIESVLRETIEKYDRCMETAAALFEESGIAPPASGNDIAAVRNIADHLIDPPAVTEEMLRAEIWDLEVSSADELIGKIEKYQSLRETNSGIFRDSLYGADVDRFITEHDTLLKKARTEFLPAYGGMPLPEGFTVFHQHLGSLMKENELKDAITAFDQPGYALFGQRWSGTGSDPDFLEELFTLALLFQEWHKNGRLPKHSVAILETGIPAPVLKGAYQAGQGDSIREVLRLLREYQSLKAAIDSTFLPEITTADIEVLHADFDALSRKFYRSILPGYRRLKGEICAYYRSPPGEDARLLHDLSRVRKYREISKTLQEADKDCRAFFGSLWNGTSSDPAVLEDTIELARLFSEQIHDGPLGDRSCRILEPGISSAVLLNPEFASHYTEVRAAIESLREYQAIRRSLRDIFAEPYDETDYDTYFNAFSLFKQKIHNEIGPQYLLDVIPDVDTVLGHLRSVAEANQLAAAVAADQAGPELFGVHWKGVASDPVLLATYRDWILTFRELLATGRINETTIAILCDGGYADDLVHRVQELERADAIFRDSFIRLTDRLNADLGAIFGSELGSIEYRAIGDRLDVWKAAMPTLVYWSEYLHHRSRALRTVAGPFIKPIEDEAIDWRDILPTFEGTYADGMLKAVFEEEPILAECMKELQDQRVGRFRELDRRFIDLNKKRLYTRAHACMPRIPAGASRNSEAGILLGEFNKKRNIMPIRKLMSRAGRLIQAIKPCFMMSPISIAQFLDSRTADFDVILFDEASQVRPEDALGALLRGKQLVVMGDTRQLPPTRFFDTIGETSDEEDLDEIAVASDMESILNLCRQSFMTRTLRWHYRSRHESLIAVSNRLFYDNQLYVYPSPNCDAETHGLKFVHLPDTVYDRGRSGVNREEARHIAAMVIEHFQRCPEKTLGVGTLNVRQQEAVLEEIEVLVSQHPFIEQRFRSEKGENLFVKNIETIQGDERDVIIVSVGFGFDENHKLSHNFGPINQEGGERRLNVLMTRAREKCVIVSNFTARDLAVGATSAFGLRALKAFLEYAETGSLETRDLPGGESDSPFEDAVYEFLRDSGYDVQKQVGCAGYRIDLAVADPDRPGRYLLGIECDGAQYHASKVARDRDRLRQEVLEGLGWTIYRIWSTDWYRHTPEARASLIGAVEAARCRVEPEPESDPFPDVLDAEELASDLPESESLLLPGSIDDDIPEYEKCPLVDLLALDDLMEIDDETKIQAIMRLVEVEGPIHKEAVIQRFRTECDMKRVTPRIREHIDHLISCAEYDQKIHAKGDFLWPNGDRECRSVLRKRNGDSAPNIAWICPEEIAEAIIYVLEKQHSTEKRDLAVQASRLLGFRVTRSGTLDVIEREIERLMDESELEMLPSGMIYFASS
ncbi:DUF3320 domain-containing protein [Methanoculleus sp. FWC-SCC1]|uniref:DUF3320 domain-containing protein n=1 Tax=Methanoculleus frigidifontis TaxID=2584085 RepID=A0ABT8M7D5_9EURY|nr:DUF3320 domain-containing protein [Methanoculleus sp. FWC-SCC1]MDN7023843.1 DUF3320 domain-containing protein [Methanoculleus sp. FWC-SCC1]